MVDQSLDYFSCATPSSLENGYKTSTMSMLVAKQFDQLLQQLRNEVWSTHQNDLRQRRTVGRLESYAAVTTHHCNSSRTRKTSNQSNPSPRPLVSRKCP